MRDIAKTINLSDPSQDFFTAAKNLNISNTSSNVSLNWSAATSSNGIDYYKVYRRLSGSSTNYSQGTTTALSFTQSRPSSDASYYVKAIDYAGRTMNSAEVKYISLKAPTNLTVSKGTTTVKLSWTASQTSAGIKEYRVYRRLYGSLSSYFQGSTTSLSFSQSLPSRSAYYYVKAVDVNGESKNSSTVYMAR